MNYHPAWSPNGSKIAFVSTRDDAVGEIYVMDADGDPQTRLTSNAARDDHPTWSPDGTAIAWSSGSQIWVMDSDGTDRLQLTTAVSNEGASWAPQRPRLTIGKAGLGAGTVTAPGIACGTDCTELYGYEASSTLTAAALPGSRFTGWGGACAGLVATCTVSMEATKLVTASFARVVAGKVCSIVGTPGRDTLNGTSGNDVICTLGGNDTARGRGGNDWLFLGAGKDRGYGERGADRIFGERGRDLLVGGPQRDRLNGGPGNDTCLGRGDVKRAC